MDEFDLIRRYFMRQPNSPNVIAGVGDDGAIIEPPPGKQLVTVIDTLVEDVHFPVGTSAADIGYRVVAVNLSDLAAMGAKPEWMTLALTLVDAESSWLDGFAEGLYEAAGEWQVDLVGGDTTRGERVVVSVQMTGSVAPGEAIQRGGAEPGDQIFVTGTIGDAAAGLQALTEARQYDELASRFLRPGARVEVGLKLAGIASAGIDLSDGLLADLNKLIEASEVGAELDLDAVPLSTALLERFNRSQALEFATVGGDDYELCFTLPASRSLPEFQVPVTCIGEITAGGDLVCRKDGDVVAIDNSGYRHFQ